MIAKLFEVRDEGTLIPVMAIKMTPHDEREWLLLLRAGYGPDSVALESSVMLINLNTGFRFTVLGTDSHTSGRTLKLAGRHIDLYFDSLFSGSVIDVQYLLGETSVPCPTSLRAEP